VESLRDCGFTRADATAVGELLSVAALRRYVRAGPRAWNRKIAADLQYALAHDIHAIRSRSPQLAEFYEQGIRAALSRF
jgi:hypothetical protein